MKDYNKLREWLSEQEHIQWETWSKELASRLESWCKEDWSKLTFEDKVNEQIEKWKIDWIPYKDLPEVVKEFDRVWADKILDNLPFKCPIWQCGGIMITSERHYPEGKNENDFPDGMVGDFQNPDLVCLNCGVVYERTRRSETINQKQT